MLLTCLTVGAILASCGICLGCGGFDSLAWLWILPVGFLGSFLGLLILAFLFVWVASLLVDTSKPQEEDSKFYRWLTGLIAEAAIPILGMRVHLSGLEKTPKDGRFLLVCNHLSEADLVALMYYFRKSQLAFISKRENANMFIIGRVMHKLLCPLINRENDREALKTILRSIQLLKEDKVSIGVFPEGYIHKDKKLHEFRSGVFKIAQKANVPIVVCTLTNTNHVFHNAARLKKTDIDLHLLEVIPPEELKGVTTVDIAHRVYRMMADDLGPDRVSEQNT